MSLLRDIQSSAVDANEPIGTLLRKCKILAARLGNEEFKNWVEYELNGYMNRDDIPEYRIMSVACKGFFSGPFGSKMENAEIPSLSLPKDFREGLFTSYISQPVSSVESLIESSDGSTVREPWSTDFTAHFGAKIYQGMNCLQAWKVIPVNNLIGMLDMIRNKVLDFALEIEAENPEAGDAPVNSKPVPEEKVSQIFNTYITGNVQNVATGSSQLTQHAVMNKNDQLFNELLQALSEVNANIDSKDKIMGAVEDMRDSQGTGSFVDKYKSFMSVLSDHTQVYGAAAMPFVPSLAALIT